MILKELDPFLGGPEDLDARISADRMAYYLRRFYRRSTDVDVINELSVSFGTSVARVDHLLLHSHGLMVLVREDFAGRVKIDDDGQWQQSMGAQRVAMGSPITRAYVQALLLKAFLDKRVRQKGFFDDLELDVLVVVSDDCEVEWPTTGRLAEVCSRDQVLQRVTARLAECKESAKGAGPLTAKERRILGRFLCVSHCA
ncbi:MAG: NERD domain-containing protein [Burkholderiaceae bacterium]